MIAKLHRHHRRLEDLSLPRKAYYVASVLWGELIGSRGVGHISSRLIEIALTHRCQCRCVHCYSYSAEALSDREELTTVEIKYLLEKAKKIGFVEVNFTGGEPLLREDLLILIRHARRLGLISKINTNGVLLSSSMIRELKKSGLKWCAVSIDSAKPERHDQLRRFRGCFEKAVAGVEEAIRQGIPASITTYARRDSLLSGDLADIVALGHRLKVDTVRILLPVPIGRFEDAWSEVLTLEEREKVRELMRDPIVTMESPREGSRCAAALTKVSVLPNGDVTPCVFVPYKYGNFRQQDLEDIWDEMEEFCRLYKPNGQCPMCNREFVKKYGYSKPLDFPDRRPLQSKAS